MSPNHDHNRRFGRGDQVERVKQIPNGRHVPWNVQIVVIITHARIRQIGAPARAVVRLPGNEYPSQPHAEENNVLFRY